MNYWLKTSICFLILLFSQSQVDFAAGEINQPMQMAVGPVELPISSDPPSPQERPPRKGPPSPGRLRVSLADKTTFAG